MRNPIQVIRDLWNCTSIVKSRYLSIRYYDRDTVLEETCFEILCQFIEKERPLENIDGDNISQHTQALRELKTLYDWWYAYQRFDFAKEFPKGTPYRSSRMDQKKKEFRQELTTNLHRLIDLRGFMWT